MPQPRRVINAKGPATVLGGARVSEPVIQATADAMRQSVHIPELQAHVGATIAELTGAESAFVTGCAAAGMAIGVAAAIGGADLAQVTSLPRTTHSRTEVVIQKAHMIIVGGCNADQVIRLGGGTPVEVGTAADCTDFQLGAELGPNTAAGMFVDGERAHGSGLLSLSQFAEQCHAAGVPVIVDAAGTVAPGQYLDAGADLVIISAHKWFRGPTAGIVVGRHDLIHAAYLHSEFGVGRPMKAGKEAIAGVLAAVQTWTAGPDASRQATERALATGLVKRLAGLAGITAAEAATQHESTAAATVRIDVDPAAAHLQAWQLADATEAMDPSVALYDYEAAQGYLLVDPGFLDEGDDELIAEAIRQVHSRAQAQPFDIAASPAPRFATLVERVENWRNRS